MAVELTAQQLAYRLRLIADVDTALEEPQLSVVNGVLAAATDLVMRYAPNAPDGIHNEAATRLAGFLYDTSARIAPVAKPYAAVRRYRHSVRLASAAGRCAGF